MDYREGEFTTVRELLASKGFPEKSYYDPSRLKDKLVATTRSTDVAASEYEEDRGNLFARCGCSTILFSFAQVTRSESNITGEVSYFGLRSAIVLGISDNRLVLMMTC